MTPLDELSEALYGEEVSRARVASPDDKLLEGARLFHRACRLMADGIRHAHPELDDAGVQAVLVARLERIDAVESA